MTPLADLLYALHALVLSAPSAWSEALGEVRDTALAAILQAGGFAPKPPVPQPVRRLGADITAVRRPVCWVAAMRSTRPRLVDLLLDAF